MVKRGYIHLYMTEDQRTDTLHRALKIKALQKGTDIAHLLPEIIAEYLTNEALKD